MKKLLFFLLLLISFSTFSQEQRYQVACVGFYNVENLFDTVDDPITWDTEFTPNGGKGYTADVYQEKLANMSQVIAEMATEFTPDGLAVLGVSEVENRKVMEDLVAHKNIRSRNYQIIHYESPDFRGIDVGLIYQPKYFQPVQSKALPLLIYENNGDLRVTRDILYVKGILNGDTVHIMVNHWPSRRGGQSATQPYRNAGALVCKNVSDSLFKLNPQARIIIMGDLNDDPSSPSVKKVLGAKAKAGKVGENDFFNPYYRYYKKGIGTGAWRDAWSLFDQVIISSGWLDKKNPGFHYMKAKIHNKKHLVQKSGQYKGYPFRTFSGDAYIGGYSDHFGVYLVLAKAVEQ